MQRGGARRPGEGPGAAPSPVRAGVGAIGLGTVGLAFVLALPFSLANARLGVAIFAVVLGAAALRAARRSAVENAPPPPPPIPLRPRRRDDDGS